MHTLSAALAACALALAAGGCACSDFGQDRIMTSAGALELTFIGHGSLMMKWGGQVIHVDPYGKLADYDRLPDADLVLITHQHRDHLDPEALGRICAEKTVVILTEKCAETMPAGIVMKNGDQRTVVGIPIKAVAAYNLIHKRDNGEPFHPKGAGNGYVLGFADTNVYIAGDTENIAEMADLRDIAVAFLPMNLPYTMTPQMVAEAARAFRPRILYPYHTGETDVSELADLLKDEPGIEVRTRKMK